MVRAIMHGCNGKMGRVITGLIWMMTRSRLWQELIHIQVLPMIIRYLKALSM